MASINCYQKIEEAIFGQDIIDGLENYAAKSFREKCNCLPACTTIIYDGDIDRSKFDWAMMQESFQLPLRGYAERYAFQLEKNIKWIVTGFWWFFFGTFQHTTCRSVDLLCKREYYDTSSIPVVFFNGFPCNLRRFTRPIFGHFSIEHHWIHLLFNTSIVLDHSPVENQQYSCII